MSSFIDDVMLQERLEDAEGWARFWKAYRNGVEGDRGLPSLDE